MGDHSSQDTVSEDAANEQEMLPEQLAEARQYGRLRLVAQLLDQALDLVFLAVMAFIFAWPLDAWLEQALGLTNDWARLAIFFVVMTGLHLLISFPLSLYAGHVLEHRFGLSRLSLTGWLWRYLKVNLLTVVFGLLLVLGLFALLWETGPWWWVWAGAVMFAVSVLAGQLVPVLIVPLFYRVTPLDRPDLVERIANLAKGTGLSIEGIYRIDIGAETTKANAMLTGVGRTRRVMLGDTLLENFSADEIEVVLAHEVGHHVYRHIPKMIVLGAAYSFVSFWIADVVLRAAIAGWELDGGYRALPVAILPLLLLVITGFSLLLQPLQNGVSRHFERQCDRYALDRTGLPNAYRTAFRKLSRINKSDPDPNPIETFLFHSHPPIAERLAMAESWQSIDRDAPSVQSG